MISHQFHTISPVYDAQSRVLILGSFPSVKSRESGFFYGNPRNRFWNLLAMLAGRPVPQDIPDKKQLLHETGIALWDVILSCDIAGSSDSSIRNAVPADIGRILAASPIEAVYLNGKTAEKLYKRFGLDRQFRSAVTLPSTSPANASCSLEQLYGAWKIILDRQDR